MSYNIEEIQKTNIYNYGLSQAHNSKREPVPSLMFCDLN